jgi:hypothetical protein
MFIAGPARTHSVSSIRIGIYYTSASYVHGIIEIRKDAIVASFNLDPRSFKPKINITTNEIQILAKRHRPSERSRDREELLGFIRFNKKAGSLELTNFNAQLGPQHLSLGGTTKRGHDRFVGVHGEGFKLAALVLCRNRLAVRFQASSHYWNFCFRGVGLSNFYCRIARPKEEVLKRKKEKFRRKCETGARKGLTANIWEDVSVKITKGRGESGPAISEAEFESWLKVAIELDQPESKDIVETDHGDLILKEEFRGRIYLKGLLVSVESSDRTGYSYGYNFVRGRINRDRERMMDREEESQMLAMIWEQSITSRGDSITKKYLKLLRGSHRVADIAMVEEKVTITTAETLWRQLRTEEPNTFFFPIAETSDLQTLDQASFSFYREPLLIANK